MRRHDGGLAIAASSIVLVAVACGPGPAGTSALSEAPAVTQSPRSTPAGATNAPNPALVWQVRDGISQPLGLALGSDGTTYVVDYRDNVIDRIDASGSLLSPWPSAGSGHGQLAAAAGIAIDSADFIYVADHNNYRVEKFDSSGAFVAAWGSRGTGPGQFDGPDGIAVAPDGDIWVSEDANRRIQVFDSNGNFRRAIEAGAELAFGDPTGIAFANGRAYVADFKANRVWVLSMDGALQTTIGRAGSGDGEFDGMSFMTADPRGHLFATDYGNGRIQEFAADGTFVDAITLAPTIPFSRPYGIAVGPDGDIYVSESGAGRVDRVRHGQ